MPPTGGRQRRAWILKVCVENTGRVAPYSYTANPFFLGDCTNQSCAAHKKGRVIIPWGRRHFDFFEDEHKSVCPVCAKYVQPIICGFTNTQWRATGIRKTGPGVAAEKVDFPWKTAPEGKYTTFDDDPKNYARWKDLRIEVTPIRG